MDLVGIVSGKTLRWTDAYPVCSGHLRDLNDEEREEKDMAMEAEDKCTVPQLKDCRYLWKLDKVRGRVSFGASSKSLALRTPRFGDFSPAKLMVGFCPPKWSLN